MELDPLPQVELEPFEPLREIYYQRLDACADLEPADPLPQVELDPMPRVKLEPGSSGAEVSTLADMMNWHHYFVSWLDDQEVEQLAYWLDQPMSSAFSGIEAPRVARACLAEALMARSGRRVYPRTLSVIECDKDAQQELLVHSAVGCVFGNLNDFYVPFLQPVVQKLEKTPGKAWAILKPSIVAGVAVQTTAMCLRHKRPCKLTMAHCHIAGTCCQDHSDFGLQRGLQGKGASALLAWLGLRLLLQEPQIIQENVKSFPPVFRC